jgi:class 3 adenylate cyclase
MDSAWLSYVPQHVAQDLVRHPAQGPLGREQRFEAVALFADVSGFTAMSEALARSGKPGTEELTDVLNSYFGPMIELIQSYGGIIGKFGGDAMTVLFPVDRSRRAAIRRALQCTLDMQAAMGRYAVIDSSAGTFSLAMKAGLALGPVLCTTIGDPQTQLEYIVAGGVLDRSADAEHHASPGEVVVSDDLLRYAGAVEIAWRRDDMCCVAGLKRRARPAPLAPLGTLPAEVVRTIARYLHPAIAQLLVAGQAGFINEHRKVTVLFMNFGELDYDHDPHVSATLQLYLSAVIPTICPRPRAAWSIAPRATCSSRSRPTSGKS